MRILSIEGKPFHEIKYENVDNTRRIVRNTLPLIRGYVDWLPEGLEGILLTSDLQGREPRRNTEGNMQLLGELLAESLISLLNEELPSLERIGVVLAGDFSTRPNLDRRGGYGDVRGIWRAFIKYYRWTVGIAGNHDLFSKAPSIPEFEAFLREDGVNFLDGNLIRLDSLRIAGISGIIGNPSKPFRREQTDYVNAIRKLLNESPDILILHDGPDIPETNLMGNQIIREALHATRPPLIVRGHKYWSVPLAELPNGIQVLNVDSRVVLLTK